MEKKIIRGAGGGSDSSSSRTPVEDANSLQSKSYVQILDLISEGEVHGLVNGLKSIYLDETPIENPDGTKNFSADPTQNTSDVTVEFRSGTQYQSYIQGFPSAENEVEVNVEVKKDSPVVRTIYNENVSAVNVRIVFPQMTFSDQNTGDLKGTSVEFAIERNSNGSGWVEAFKGKVTGKTTSKFLKSYRVNLPPGEGPHLIRVVRISADPVNSYLQNRIYFGSYGEMIEAKLRYPNSALVAIRVDAAQFQSIPTRSYDMYLMKIKIPSNYNPWTRTYTGIWDGTFKVEWSNNPAWVFNDIVTNDRYGLGAHINPDLVDKWRLYKIARYCDEMVPDGFGGTEPRFTLNCYIQTRTEAFTLLQNLASVMRAMVFWSSGLVTLSQDAPEDVSHIFTPSNVIDGKFTYSGTSAKDRYNVALVTWNDPSDMCRPKVEYVEDQDGIAKFGVNQSEVAAFGCTSRGQAHRFGQWLLYTSKMETETVTFGTGIEAASIRPGQIIKVHDPVRAGTKLGGRIKAVGHLFVDIDRDITHISNQFDLSVMLPNGTVEVRKVTGIEGNRISIQSNFSIDPHINSVWLLKSKSIEAQMFRIVSIAEDAGKFSIVALAHDPQKFAFIEQGLEFQERSTSSLSSKTAQPDGLKVTETLYESNGTVKIKATFSWSAVVNSVSYAVAYRKENGNQIDLGSIRNNEVEILDIEPGNYTFMVQSISLIGVKSARSSIKATIRGKSTEPGGVVGFSLVPMGGVAYLSWEASKDLDVLVGGSVRIRHSSQTNPDWKHGVDVALLSGSSTRAQVPLMNGTYMAKFIDSMSVASNIESRIYTDVLNSSKLNVVKTSVQHPNFTGEKVKMHFADDLNGLTLSPALTFDEVESVDDLPLFDFLGGVTGEGIYYFDETVDLHDVLTANLKAFVQVDAIGIADDIDSRSSPIDEWRDFDGAWVDTVNAEIQFRSTNDDPEDVDADWSVWKRFFVGEYTARAYQFRLIATSTNKDHTIVIKTLSISVDVPDRTINLNDLESDLLGSSIVFEAPFFETPAIGITILNQQKGDYPDVSNKTKFGFDITIRDENGIAVVRDFDVLVKGFGRIL